MPNHSNHESFIVMNVKFFFFSDPKYFSHSLFTQEFRFRTRHVEGERFECVIWAIIKVVTLKQVRKSHRSIASPSKSNGSTVMLQTGFCPWRSNCDEWWVKWSSCMKLTVLTSFGEWRWSSWSPARQPMIWTCEPERGCRANALFMTFDESVNQNLYVIFLLFRPGWPHITHVYKHTSIEGAEPKDVRWCCGL
jgi:hypothetical protein